MHWKRRGLLVAFLLALLALIPMSSLNAQDGITIQVALPEFMENFLSEDTFAQFEADNGVKVNPVYTGFDSLFSTPPVIDLEGHLEDAQEYASKADVVAITETNLSVEGTRAGYYLDLSPLVSADTSLNVDDFIPAAWESFQWDGGIWALPVTADLVSVIYDPAAFDEAGLAYPNEAWTIDDFANAARALATFDSSGKVTSPGLVTFNNGGYLLRGLLGRGFYDDSTIPDTPSFNDPALEALLTTWAELEAEGVISSSFSGEVNSAPFRIFGTSGMGGGFRPNNDTPEAIPALLPGGVTGMSVYGFAVSSGTQYPELAYALANYLTYNIQLANGPFGIVPARQSLNGVQPQADPDAQVMMAIRMFPPELQAFIDQGVSRGLPIAEMRYSDYVMNALESIVSDGLDAHTALQDAEAVAVTNLQTAADQKATTAIYVATPVPEVALQPGEIELIFGMTSFIQPMPNRELWDQLMLDFAASDPQVGKVTMETGFGGLSNNTEQNDCFYLPYNAVPDLDTSTVLNLDPFLDVDPTFDRSDIVGNALSMVQKEGRTWALPIVILPEVLRYNADLFAQAGIPEPESGWTIDQFNDALLALAPLVEDNAPFVPRGVGGSYLAQLIAAYGGLPIDKRTDPPTLNYTDPATVAAIRQVLDLAKEGYIEYQELARSEFMMMVNDEMLDPIYTQTMNGIGFRQEVVIGEGQAVDPYRTTTYPTGQYNSLSYDMGTAYISATTQNAEACYRWLSMVAQHPELFSAMPARRSTINDPAFAADQGEDVVAVYNQFDALMSDPNTINLQSPFAGGSDPGNFLLEFWLNRAFDHYVLEDADLEAELAEAQTYAQGYQECVANIPPFDEAVEDRREYMQAFSDCARSVDPEMGGLFAAPA